MDKTKLPSAPDLSTLTGASSAADPAGKTSGTSAAPSDTPPAAAPSAPAKATPGAAPLGDRLEKSGLPSRLAEADGGERAGIFRQLVSDDGDIAGLVAYSIYKQNKLDWLNAFDAAKRRAPTEDELAAYILGEGTPRRIATYRHLAEATLAGNGPAVGSSVATGQPRVVARPGFGGGNLAVSVVATYALVAILLLIVFLLLAHYTMNPR